MGRRCKKTEKKEDFNFTEEYIQKRLDGFFAESTKKYVLENLYVFSWESDKLIETRSGLIYEFEIKISKSDFKNDFKNKKDKHVILEGTSEFLPSYDEVKKEYDYAERYKDNYRTSRYKKPNYFYYAVPEGMIEASDVPSYAGLIYVLPDGAMEDMNGKYNFQGFYVVKAAPKIHEVKYSDDELKLSEKFYYNMLSWKNKYRDERKKQLLSEGQEQKMTYAELLDKYEKTKRENKAWKAIVDQNAKSYENLNDIVYENNRVIRAYRDKMKEIDKDFNILDFECDAIKNDE